MEGPYLNPKMAGGQFSGKVKNPDKEEIKYEISDFLYHMMVLMVEKGVSWEEITKELVKR